MVLLALKVVELLLLGRRDGRQGNLRRRHERVHLHLRVVVVALLRRVGAGGQGVRGGLVVGGRWQINRGFSALESAPVLEQLLQVRILTAQNDPRLPRFLNDPNYR